VDFGDNREEECLSLLTFFWLEDVAYLLFLEKEKD
jgi:hypothetical protein